MVYLEQSDLDLSILATNLQQIISNDESIIDTAESYALDEIRSYLSGRYDLDMEFSLNGDARRKDLVRRVVAITMYLLHQRLTPRQIPETRQSDYELALSWLKKVNKGELNLQIAKINPSQTVPITWGGNKKTSNFY
jgi:phage gp36-like protein